MTKSKTLKKKIIKRKSPIESATLFKVGTKKKGVDGKIWIIKVTSNGVKRWVLFTTNHNNNGSKTTKKIISRKSPIESATLFEVGTKKKGINGKIWIIKVTSSGVKQWVPFAADISNMIKNDDNLITFFNVKIIPKLKSKIKKIGHLDIITNKIGIGELIWDSR
jgi:hypothetical protein